MRECGHLLLWLGNKVRKVEENRQKSWVGSCMGSRSWTKTVRTGKAGQSCELPPWKPLLLSATHMDSSVTELISSYFLASRNGYNRVWYFPDVGFDPLVTPEDIRVHSKWWYIFCETFFLVINVYIGQNIFLAWVRRHRFIELQGQGLSQSPVASNSSY